jgi:ABC-type transport system involved in cytochrome c biogenesis permease component
MSDRISLPVGATVLAAWRQFAARPDYVLHVAWIPALLIFAVGALSGVVADGPPVADFWLVVLALLNFAVLVQALVAWQRYALPQSHPRKGLTGLRAGRAEFFSLLHFPLVGVLFVPLIVPTLIESLTATQEVGGGADAVATGLVGLALLVFPGGLLLIRAALMLTAIAAAGKTPISLIATANRVWRIGAGNSIRLLLAFYLTVLPAALAFALLPDGMPALAQAAASGVLLVLYVMLCGGALAGAYGQLAAGSGKSGKTAS